MNIANTTNYQPFLQLTKKNEKNSVDDVKKIFLEKIEENEKFNTSTYSMTGATVEYENEC